jgi:protoheme ferro-lyase
LDLRNNVGGPKTKDGLSPFYSEIVGDALTNPKKLYIYIYIERERERELRYEEFTKFVHLFFTCIRFY